MPDGTAFDGNGLLGLVQSGISPFSSGWDVKFLIQEVEENLGARVTDIPFVSKGPNNYGFHIKLSNGTDIVARLSRSDVNMPDYDGFPIDVLVPEVNFEAAVYSLLCSDPTIISSRLLYHRLPLQHAGPRLACPKDILGRRLLAFGRAEGENNVWRDLGSDQRASLLAQAAFIRASLFNFRLPLDFATHWFSERLFEHKPAALPVAPAPTREFCLGLFTSKIEATIKNEGDMIGWEDDHETVGPVAAAAKQSLLRIIPHILPKDGNNAALYRLVLEHGDFGIHNMSIKMGADSQPQITSLYDWETGCIAPVILSDPLMAVSVNLSVDGDAKPSITRVPGDASTSDVAEYMGYAKHYFKVRFFMMRQPTMRMSFGRAETHATSGLLCEIGAAKIQKDTLPLEDVALIRSSMQAYDVMNVEQVGGLSISQLHMVEKAAYIEVCRYIWN
ncbi:hypothetical protein NLG97_g7363 [Lecanicillium saksenae]|uniref:Uncharacterized protein n=1 Tax=Lecanicillium saksenae TaxID=468837 RepID=A0ACC1QQV0_9HYPO|nr:hypothetical protein NLG97_g7363 [Lecanicillium saksenae]